MKTMQHFSRLLLCAFVLASASAVNAQTPPWPTRSIKLIVPTGPGAATDVMARLMAEAVARGLGQPLVVENLPGASGILAHQAAARAPADGYTFLFTNTSGLAINPVSFKSIPYDPARDFVPEALRDGKAVLSDPHLCHCGNDVDPRHLYVAEKIEDADGATRLCSAEF